MDSFERILWWLFGSSAGASTRARVVLAIREEPRNAKQLADALHLDYSSVRHHLRVLLKNRLIVTAGERYGQVYFPSATLEGRWATLEGILARTRRNVRRGIGDGDA